MVENSENLSQFVVATDAGCVRELNEDSVFAEDGLWIVADGMGGHACGEVASAVAINEVGKKFDEYASLSDAIQSAHQKIIEQGRENDAQAGMGTTVVAMKGDDIGYQIAWVGDSRAYKWDDSQKTLTQISEDHSLMVRLINAGLITPQDAIDHPQRHMITQCLGSEEIEQLKVDSIEADWEGGQQILLCSDGLTDEVSDDMIKDIMGSSMTLTEKSETLVRTAKQAGGRDNISIIIVQSPIELSSSWLVKIRKFFSL